MEYKELDMIEIAEHEKILETLKEQLDFLEECKRDFGKEHEDGVCDWGKTLKNLDYLIRMQKGMIAKVENELKYGRKCEFC